MRIPLLFSAALLLCGLSAQAQTLSNQPGLPVVVSGGIFEFTAPYQDYVTVAVHTAPNAKVVLDTIKPDQSAQGAHIDYDTLWVAAERQVRRYNLANYVFPSTALQASSPTISGIRRMALSSRYVVISRGYGAPAAAARLMLLDRRTLAVVDSVMLPDDAEGLTVRNDSAFVTMPGAFGSTSGALALVSLTNKTFTTIEMGPQGLSIAKVFAQPGSGEIYTLNTLGFGASQGIVARLKPAASGYTVSYDTIAGSLSDMSYRNDTAYLKIGTGLRQYDPMRSMLLAPVINIDAAAFLQSAVSPYVYVTETDYNTYGKLTVYRPNTLPQPLMYGGPTGVSPEVLAEWRGSNIVASAKAVANQAPIRVYPNPAKNALHLEGITTGTSVEILAADGRLVLQTRLNGAIDLASLEPGLYLVRVPALGYQQRIVKQ